MEINTYFTRQTKVKKIILDMLDKSQFSVVVAVAWFTESELFDKLISLQRRNVDIQLIITNHPFNHQSSNNYELINSNGGFFAEVGNDEQLMHMKFCIIDYSTVISGSANWTGKAFNVNNEEVTIVTDSPKRANDFLNEFTRLKKLSRKINESKTPLKNCAAIKILDLIKAFIQIGDTSSIIPYVHKLKDNPEMEHIVNLLLDSKFDIAINEINEYKKGFSQLIDVISLEKSLLELQINLISLQIEALEIEKTEAQGLINRFNHMYVIELNPIIAKILTLKKKIYEKLRKQGIFDDTYNDLENEFKKNQESYKNESKIKINSLNKEDQRSIKEIYYEAVKYCHPDSALCIYNDDKDAQEVFSKLSLAYQYNNIEEVKYILSQLKLGKHLKRSEYNHVEFLRAKLATLMNKYTLLSKELEVLKKEENLNEILKIKDWDEYFSIQKDLLNNELDQLNKKYTDNG